MHLELVVPALLAAQAADPLPALELLLARGRRRDGSAATLESWLSLAFKLSEEDRKLPAGALTALAAGIDPGARFWLRADPVHLRADRDRLLLVPSQAFAVSREEAEALCGALSELYKGELEFHAPRPDAWCVAAKNEIPLEAAPPVALAGANVDANQPAKQWHALINEMQMALYQHPVNTAREARGEPALNSVWLWGAGRLPAATRGPWQSVSADDPVAAGLARLAGIRHTPLAAGAREWFAQAPADGRHLVVLDGLRAARVRGDADALAALEQRWFAPLLEALKAGRIGMVTLHAPEAGASFETIRGDLRRFWRRPRPLASYAS